MNRRRRHKRTTLRQWKAFEACNVHHLTQAKAAVLFGVSQSAISRRLQRHRENTAARYAATLSRGGKRRHVVRTMSLSFLDNA